MRKFLPIVALFLFGCSEDQPDGFAIPLNENSRAWLMPGEKNFTFFSNQGDTLQFSPLTRDENFVKIGEISGEDLYQTVVKQQLVQNGITFIQKLSSNLQDNDFNQSFDQLDNQFTYNNIPYPNLSRTFSYPDTVTPKLALDTLVLNGNIFTNVHRGGNEGDANTYYIQKGSGLIGWTTSTDTFSILK